MFSVFPDLLAFSMLATFVLRVTVGLFFLIRGTHLLQFLVKAPAAQPRLLGAVYATGSLITGTLLVLGLYTQPAAIAGIVLSSFAFDGWLRKQRKSEQQVNMLLAVICLSLLFLGPGIFAFDLPL